MTGEQKKAVTAGVWFIITMLVVAMACNLSKKDEDTTSQVNVGDPPTIRIVNPPQTHAADSPLTIQVEAVDPTGQGVTEVQLLVDNAVKDTKSAQELTGAAPFIANLVWDDIGSGFQGNVRVQVVARRGAATGRSEAIQITILAAGTQVTQTPGSGGGTGTGGTAPTSGPGYCAARVDTQGLRFRSHPDTSSDDYIISSFNLNDTPQIVGRLGDNSWYQVQRGSQQGWVFGGYVTLLDCGNTTIPVRSAPATFTPVPSPTLAPSEEPRPPDLIALVTGNVAIQLDSSGSATAAYTITVQNIGGSDSGEFDVEIILPGGQSITQTISNLVPNQQAQVSEDGSGVQSITFTQPGTRQLRVLVDFDGNVTEINENNNNASLDIIVEAADNPNQSP